MSRSGKRGVRGVGPTALALLIALSVAPGAGAQTVGSPPTPITGFDLLGGSVQPFEGTTATPWPVTNASVPPRHPFMAPNGRSNIHNDPYMTDTYRRGGPLGDGAETSTSFFRECASVAFDSRGRIETVCVGLDRPVLALLDPTTLETLAAMPLPPRNASTSPFNDFSGGGYFYLDNRDRAVITTSTRHLLVVGQTGGETPEFAVERDYDVSAQVPSGEGIISALPDWRGRLWFVTRNGIVGTVDRRGGAVKTLRLQGEGISNSFSVDETGGVFIVSDRALYRFDAARSGAPRVTWRRVYPDSGVHKPGQSDAGSGTTPTLMGKGRVSITDNGNRMHVVVYRRARRIKPTRAQMRRRLAAKTSAEGRRRLKQKWKRRKRLICVQGVFEPGAGATDNSLIATDSAMVVENNYGYGRVTATENGETTTPGIARVDVKRSGRGCKTIWTSDEIAPSVVPKLSLANGLVYTYTKPANDEGTDAWFLTTLNFRTGRTIYRRFAGSGLGFNNNYSPVTLGPDGTAYVGVLGGLVRFAK